MSREIEVKIGNRPYRLGVEEGQDQRVRMVAEHFNTYVTKMMESAGGIDRDRVLVLAGIMLADEFMSLQQTRETETRTMESFHNNIAERLEKLMNVSE